MYFLLKHPTTEKIVWVESNERAREVIVSEGYTFLTTTPTTPAAHG